MFSLVESEKKFYNKPQGLFFLQMNPQRIITHNVQKDSLISNLDHLVQSQVTTYEPAHKISLSDL